MIDHFILLFFQSSETVFQHDLKVDSEKPNLALLCLSTGKVNRVFGFFRYPNFSRQPICLFDEIWKWLCVHQLLHKVKLRSLLPFELVQVPIEIEHIIGIHHLSTSHLFLLFLLTLLEIPQIVIECEQEKVEEALLHPQLSIRPVIFVNLFFR